MSVNGNVGKSRFASASSAVSPAMSASGAKATIRAGTSCDSRIASANATLPVASTTRAAAGTLRCMAPQPRAWISRAPICLPSPIASIFVGPLSMSPRNDVCGLTRLTTQIASAASAYASTCTGTPSGVVPTTAVSIVARIGAPTAASVTPRWASTSSCPAAVDAP